MEEPIADAAARSNRKTCMNGANLVVALCFIGALVAGAITLEQTQHRPFTQVRMQYERARVTAQSTRPSYSPPPFVGETLERVSPWTLGSTYAGIALAVVGLSTAVISVRRPSAER